VNGILGSKVPLFEVVQYLALLGLRVKTLSDRKTLDVTIPTRRKDLVDEWNLIEEIARMRGYDKVLAEAPKLPLTLSEEGSPYEFEDSLKDFLVARGGTEVINYSFLSPKEGEALGSVYKMYSLTNPLNPEESILRPSLIPGLTKALFNNIRQVPSIHFFEVGNIFWKAKHPVEQTAAAWVRTVSESGADAFLVAKSDLETLFQTFQAPERRYEPLKSPLFENGLAASVYIGKQKVAEVGVINKNLMKLYSKQSASLVGVELFLETLSTQEKAFQAISRFPVATRDISLAVSKNVTAEKIEKALKKHGTPLLQSFTLFDIFEKDESKRFAYHLTFGVSDRTITSDEVEEAFQKIVEGAKTDIGASL
jgi:phenylalanyl-tRNA synthetase beta chain